MSLVLNSVFDGGTARTMVAGDLVNLQELVTPVANAAGVTLTAQQLMTGLILRSGAAGVSDTFPDASSLVNGLLANGGYQGGGAYAAAGIQPNSSFRLKIINANTGTLTIVAGTGMTLNASVATTIATVTVKEYLIQITNGTPPVTYAATTVNASAVVTGLSAQQTLNITPGMLVTGTGITGGTTVLSVQPGIGITLSANATASGTLVALAFAPSYTVRAIS